MSASQTVRKQRRGRSSSQVGVVLSAVFLAYLGQTTLNPVIAPLSREVGLAEWQIGLTISVAAVMVVLTSQSWGVDPSPGGASRSSSRRWGPAPRPWPSSPSSPPWGWEGR